MLTFEDSCFVSKRNNMKNDHTLIYVIAGIILLHFVAGIAYLIYKLTKKK